MALQELMNVWLPTPDTMQREKSAPQHLRHTEGCDRTHSRCWSPPYGWDRQGNITFLKAAQTVCLWCLCYSTLYIKYNLLVLRQRRTSAQEGLKQGGKLFPICEKNKDIHCLVAQPHRYREKVWTTSGAEENFCVYIWWWRDTGQLR